MRNRNFLAALLAAMLVLPGFALAQESFEGNVIAGDTVAVTAPYGGTVKAVSIREGSVIKVGDPVATVQRKQTLSPVDGTVRGVLKQVGDTLSQTTVLYIAPVSKYTLTCTVDNAYPSIDNTFVHLGETVYLKCKKDGTHKAEGVITAVDGTRYTVQTTAGELYMEETVYVYRSDDYTYATRIGSGTVGRTAELAITATGSLCSLAVADGDTVERGQLLFETVDGAVDTASEPDETMTSTVAGVVASVNLSAGQSVAKGDVLLTVYPPDTYAIAFAIDEDLLGTVAVGDAVSVTFQWNEGDVPAVQGTVTGISYVSAGSESDTAAANTQTGSTTTTSSTTQYTGYVTFKADDTVREGMSVTVTTVDE